MSDGEWVLLLLILLGCVLIFAVASNQPLEHVIKLTDQNNMVVEAIDWGNLYAGQQVTRTVYVESNMNCTLHVYTENCDYLTFHNVTQQLQEHVRTPVTLTVTVPYTFPQTTKHVIDFMLNTTFRSETS